MDTGLLRPLEVDFGTASDKTQGMLFVAEPDSTDGPGHIASFARFRAGSILAQQATCRLFMDVNHIVVLSDCPQSLLRDNPQDGR